MTINPYASPHHPSDGLDRPGPWWVQGLQFCGLAVATSMTLGALANVFNGWVCPEYFTYVMGWDEDSNIWLRAILQGTLDGLVIGVVLSMAFFGVGSLLTRFRLTFGRAARYLVVVAIASVGAAATLGLLLMTMHDLRQAVLFPSGEPASPQFGWVGGCIAGLEHGGAFAAFIALIVLVVRDWLRKPIASATESAGET